MKILLSGFEPFGGKLQNPSEQVIRRISLSKNIKKAIIPIILPVDKESAPEILIQKIDETKPDAVICLGEASGRAVISIERAALNLLDFRIPDNQGNQITDEFVIPGGPVAYFSTLPVRELFYGMQSAGVPVEISLSAGAFLCNQVMYCLLHYLSDRMPHVPGGFIHLPTTPFNVAASDRSIPSMAVETSLRGIRVALSILAARLEKHMTDPIIR